MNQMHKTINNLNQRPTGLVPNCIAALGIRVYTIYRVPAIPYMLSITIVSYQERVGNSDTLSEIKKNS